MHKTVCLFLIVLFSSSCFAYLDMGTGSFLIQMLLAFLLGAIALLKIYWNNFTSFIKRIFRKKD